MNITVAAVGKLGRGPERDLAAAYEKRLSWPCRVVEIGESRQASVDQRRGEEADKLRKAAKGAPVWLALDERGEVLSSRAFAQTLEDWQNVGTRQIAMLIGGPDGLHPDLVSECRLTLSLGRLTWPHKLVRVMLAEQLYRAWTITRGHPYHRD